METKIEIKSIKGNVLFAYEKENNTLKETLEEAVRNNIDLCYADLSYAKLDNINLINENLIGIRLSNADLSNADLSGSNLHRADFNSANLRNADLSDADLSDADLYDADLYGADLAWVDLHRADLHSANLYNANLTSADLSKANLIDADLTNANLECANLNYSIIIGAILDNANLSDANLHMATLRDVELYKAKNFFIPTYLPEGEFIAWKKLPNGLIAKLKILEDSKRSRATGNKCRCDKALVLEFQNKDRSKSDMKEYTSYEHITCTYKVGEIVYADSWDDNRWNECSHGIHFFIDRQSAVDY